MEAGKLLGLFALCIVSLIICSGCTTSGTEQNPGSPQDVAAKVSFQQAFDALKLSAPSSHIYYIKGDSLQSDATAKEWSFGVIQGNDTFFFVYNGYGGSEIALPGKLPAQELIPGQFMQPKDLFKNHSLLINDLTNGGSRDIDELELRDGVYTLSQKFGTELKDYKFDAGTGKEISSTS